MELGAQFGRYFGGRDSGTDVLWQVLAIFAALALPAGAKKDGVKDIGAPGSLDRMRTNLYLALRL
jgi:hypothetical protein